MADLPGLMPHYQALYDRAMTDDENARADVDRAHAGVLKRLRKRPVLLTPENVRAFDVGHGRYTSELQAIDVDLASLADVLRDVSRRLTDSGADQICALALSITAVALQGQGLALAERRRDTLARFAAFYRGFPGGDVPDLENIVLLPRPSFGVARRRGGA